MAWNPGVPFPDMYNQNGGYIPQNFNPNQEISTPVFQQSPVRAPGPFQSAPQLNPQHVFVNNPRFPPPPQPPPSQFVPNINVIRSTPPPSFIPRVQQNMNNTPHQNMSAQFPPQQMPNLFSSPQLPNQYSSPRLPAQFSSPQMFNRSYSNQRNGFNNGPEQLQSQNTPTAFPPESAAHIRPPTFQNHPPVNMPVTFNQQAQNSNFQYGNNVNRRHNPFGSQPTNTQNSVPKRHNNYNNKNHNRNNEYRNRGNSNWKNSPNNFERSPVIKKEKEDKKLSKVFECDPCDRSYHTEAELKEHLSEHIQCNSRNCQFEAHPKIVFLHKKMQHVAGYAEKINNLSSNEEIEKWRAERRKRFPTQENIAKRQAEQAEKEARGEVIEIPEPGKMKRKRDFQRNRYQNSKRRQRHNLCRSYNSLQFGPKGEDEVSESEDSDGEPVTKLAKFAGVNADHSLETVNASISPISNVEDGVQMMENKNLHAGVESGIDATKEIPAAPEGPQEIFEEEIVINSSTAEESGGDSVKEVPVTKCSPVEAPEIFEEIVINSSTAEESGGDSVKEVPVTKCSPVEAPVSVLNTTPSLVVYDDSDNEAPTEVSSKVMPSGLNTVEDSHNPSPVESPVNKNNPPKERRDRGPKKDMDKPKRTREYIPRKKDEPKRCSISLLKSLYADEIKKERNKMFQCLRHIVQNKFFGIGKD